MAFAAFLMSLSPEPVSITTTDSSRGMAALAFSQHAKAQALEGREAQPLPALARLEMG